MMTPNYLISVFFLLIVPFACQQRSFLLCQNNILLDDSVNIYHFNY